MNLPRTYDRFPFTQITDHDADCALGWEEIAKHLIAHSRIADNIVVVECYPGTDIDQITVALANILKPALVLRSDEAFLGSEELEEKFVLEDDPVFAMMTTCEMRGFFDSEKLRKCQQKLTKIPGTKFVVGTGAILIAPHADIVVYADLTRWEIQRRQRAHEIGNLGLANHDATSADLYKRAFFLDWRLADKLKRELLPTIDFLLDTNDGSAPKLVAGQLFRQALWDVVRRPFRVVPLFDPGPWGGYWMKSQFGLPENGSNYAWCFDCVPEENSLLLGFGERRIEVPSLNLVLMYPRKLLGQNVLATFGAEFPIRFDYLDTMGGGNLSLQVHPLRAYIREKFGMDYTQDESYYMFEAAPDGAVYLGLKEGTDREQFEADLRRAQENPDVPFPAETYVNVWAARKHDHFLIPAGTIHCSGRNGVVLEISATPYIFTFKLWDWGRLGLNGLPRPVHLDHGLSNIQWDRTTEWVREHLINCIEPVSDGEGWREERTGLHELEFIETRRHWFHGTTPHNTADTVNVLNLIEGASAIVESPTGDFPPLMVNYGETFIVPACVGSYTVRPGEERAHCATIKAFVRNNHAI